jgi:hypothetical protein
MANIGGTLILLPTPGSTVTITISTDLPHQVAAWTAGQAETINISGTPNDGQLLTMVITNDATLGRLLTLGTGLLGNGTVLNIVSKKTILSFIAYGGTFHEISRTIGI